MNAPCTRQGWLIALSRSNDFLARSTPFDAGARTISLATAWPWPPCRIARLPPVATEARDRAIRPNASADNAEP